MFCGLIVVIYQNYFFISVHTGLFYTYVINLHTFVKLATKFLSDTFFF